MRRTRIHVTATSMEIGGIERSLLGLLGSIDYDACEVDLFLFDHAGPWMEEIPSRVRVLDENGRAKASKRPIAHALRTGRLLVLLARLLAKALGRIRAWSTGRDEIGMELCNEFIVRFLPRNPKRYDLAIGFASPHFYVLRNVDAGLKVGWVHTDYASCGNDIAYERRMWSRLDRIAAVSGECAKAFADRFPELRSKVIRVENVLPSERIREMAGEDVEEAEPALDDGVPVLCTVGRFSPEKNMEAIPEISRSLKERGVAHRWIVIGYGPTEPEIRSRIRACGCGTEVRLVGKRSNPYPFVRRCDVYVQPSLYEGKSVSVREAQILGRPVVVYDYPTVGDQVRDGFDGLVSPQDPERCAALLADLLANEALRSRLSMNCGNGDYSNRDSWERFLSSVGKEDER